MIQYHRLVFSPALIALLFVVSPAGAATWVDTHLTIAIDPLRGADETVDYGSLIRTGPLDDRNYRLTQEDLALCLLKTRSVLIPKDLGPITSAGISLG